MIFSPWEVDENAGEEDRQEKDEEAQSLLFGMLLLPTAPTAEGNWLANCCVPEIDCYLIGLFYVFMCHQVQ